MNTVTLSRTWRNRIGRGRDLARWIAVAALGVGAFMGFCAGVKVFLVAPHPNEADIAAIAYRVDNQRDAAGQFAAEFVGAVLSTPESHRDAALARFITRPTSNRSPQVLPASDPPPAVIDTPRAWSVVATGTAGEANLYSAIIMVQQRPHAFAPSTMAFYRVPVSIWRYQPRAMDMPTPIADPGPGADVVISYDHALSPSSPVYAVVAGFINTYLTSTTGLDRYVVADSWIKPIGGYQSASITTVAADAEEPAQPAAGSRIHVRATVTAQTAQFATIPFTFPLTVENSGGTWMITAIDLKPQTAADSAAKPAGTTRP
ncbi:MAG: conjugal transfer protein [Actinomycetota bacterium]|nr:conjugal transfer protein [Actinomycetota bacterium]